MHSNEEIYEANSESLDYIGQLRDSAIVISNINYDWFIHSNILDIMNQNIEAPNNLNVSDSDESNQSNIIDVSLLTKRLEIDDIRLITASILIPNLDLAKQELKTYDEEKNYSESKDDILLLKMLHMELPIEKKMKNFPLFK